MAAIGPASSASVVISNPSSGLDHNRSRLSRWGGLLAVLTTTENFEAASRDDPDITQMIDTVQRLEVSLQDWAVHGPQKMVDAFIACQLTPALLNRWNSRVLDGLWQAVTGRTPDGITPFALNPPHTAAELLDRLVLPRAYPEAVDLVMKFINVEHGGSLLLVPAIVTCACAGHVDILKRLLACSLDKAAEYCLSQELPRIAACGRVPCCEIIFPHLIAFGSESASSQPITNALVQVTLAGDVNSLKFLRSHYQFDLRIIETASQIAAKRIPSPSTDAIFELLFPSVLDLPISILPQVLHVAASGNHIALAQRVLDRGVDGNTCASAASFALEQPFGTKVLELLLAQLNADRRIALLREVTRWRWTAFVHDFKALGVLLWDLRDQPRPLLQLSLDDGLLQAVIRAHPEKIALFLHHGAHARAGRDHIIYLAALSGRADMMELLLGAADVDAECAARYRQQMSEPAGLLGVAQQLRHLNSSYWQHDYSVDNAFYLPSQELSTALCGGSVPALEWLLTPLTLCSLISSAPLVHAVRAGNLAVVRALFNPRCIAEVASRGKLPGHLMSDIMRAAREAQNFDLIQLLFPLSLRQQYPSIQDVRDAVQANDPFTRRYLFPPGGSTNVVCDQFSNFIPALRDACMTGHLNLFEDVLAFVRGMLGGTPEVLNTLDSRLDRALQLCTEGDLTPVIMVLMHTWNDTASLFEDVDSHPIVLCARCGHLPAVRLWLAQGIPAQWALSAAVKHGQREVVSCLIAHGASLTELCLSDQQQLQSLLQPV